MRKSSLVFLLIFSIDLFVHCQPAIQWQKSFGGSLQDYATDIKQTTDGGYILAGYAYSKDGDVTSVNGIADYWIVKLDQNAKIQWQRSFGGSDLDVAKSIQQTTDGGYVIAGSSASKDGDITVNKGGSDYLIIKLDNAGNIQWKKTFGGSENDLAECIQQTNDGGYIVAGSSNSSNKDVSGHHPGPKARGKSESTSDFWIVKLNSFGNIEWQRSFGGQYDDRAYSIQQTNDNGYIVCGYTNSNDGDVTGHHGPAGLSNTNNDYWIVKLTNTGNIQWQRSLGGDQQDICYSAKQTSDGGYIVAGASSSSGGDVTGHHGITSAYDICANPTADYWVVKLSNAGNIQWQRSLGGPSPDIAYSIAQLNDGGYIVGGATQSNSGDVSGNHGPQSLLTCPGADNYRQDYWIVRLNGEGIIQWQKCIGGSNYDIGRAIQPTTDGGFIITGEGASNNGDANYINGGYDYWVVKLGDDPAAMRYFSFVNKETIPDVEFRVYPNPAKEKTTLRFSPNKLADDMHLLLFAANGQRIRQVPVFSTITTIQLNGMVSGIYFYRLQTGKKIIKTGKIIVE